MLCNSTKNTRAYLICCILTCLCSKPFRLLLKNNFTLSYFSASFAILCTARLLVVELQEVNFSGSLNDLPLFFLPLMLMDEAWLLAPNLFEVQNIS